MKRSDSAKKTSKKNKISAIDLFCGAGGLTYGLFKEGIKVKAGIDIDPVCQYPFEANNNSKFIRKDVAEVTAEEIRALFPEKGYTLIAGCAPCQPFSKYTQGRDAEQDSKWSMLNHFARIVEEVKPDLVTMENVPQLKKHKVYKKFENKLVSLGYKISTKIVSCPDYGIPQTRQRLVLLASRLGPIELVKPTHSKSEYRTVRQVIGGLPRIVHGTKSKEDKLHLSSKMSEKNYQRIKSSKQGGSWLDWDKELVAKCHKKKSRRTYRSVYGRMSWDSPSPTITTQFTGFGNGRFGHPRQNRAISLREGALLQTFPRKYKFVPPRQEVVIKDVSRMVGNAVPVRLGEIIGRSIQSHLERVHGMNEARIVTRKRPGRR